MWAVQSMPNLKEGSAQFGLGEIKFMINLIEGVEAQYSVKLSSASYGASLADSPKPKSSIHNEPAQNMDKSPLISDYSHRRFTGLLCSDQKCSLKQLIPTVDYSLGSYVCQIGGSVSRAKKLPTTEKQSKFCPYSHFLSSSTIAHMQKKKNCNTCTWRILKETLVAHHFDN